MMSSGRSALARGNTCNAQGRGSGLAVQRNGRALEVREVSAAPVVTDVVEVRGGATVVDVVVVGSVIHDRAMWSLSLSPISSTAATTRLVTNIPTATAPCA